MVYVLWCNVFIVYGFRVLLHICFSDVKLGEGYFLIFRKLDLKKCFMDLWFYGFYRFMVLGFMVYVSWFDVFIMSFLIVLWFIVLWFMVYGFMF